ncbi:MAG: nuclease-related domain-containing protein [Lysobacterales bacterium]|jgi:hypothetical protein
MESTHFLIVLGVLLAAVLWKWMASSAKRGSRGERAVHGILRQSLPSTEYAILRGVTLPTGDGVTQIDHVVVSRFGIFVIATRDMPGWIFGSQLAGHWVQSHHHFRTEFPNPLRQNQAHIRALQGLLGFQATRFYSLVVFTGACEFKMPMPVNVMKPNRLVPFIEVRNTPLLTQGEADRALETIESSRLQPGAVAHAPPIKSQRARRAPLAPLAGFARNVRALLQQQISGRLAARVLGGVVSIALLLAVGNAYLGSFDRFTTIGGAWPVESPSRAADRVAPPSTQPERRTPKTYDRSELRCAYSIESHRCACFDPMGEKIPMEYAECRAVADRG